VSCAPQVGDFVTGAQDTVGVRVPAHPLAHELLVAFGGGLAAPSANRFGRVSPTTAQHVHEDLGADVDLVLDGGPCGVGLESTIVDLSRGTPVLLRPGGISAAQVEAVLGEAPATADEHAPRVSGSLAAHYAPRTPARLVAPEALEGEIARHGAAAAVLAFSAPDERIDFWLRMPRDPVAYAQKLYAALRELDATGSQLLLIEAPPDSPEWQAVLDRLRRAARD
jgi:L-threonylcarbamoyladenylate synthase